MREHSAWGVAARRWESLKVIGGPVAFNPETLPHPWGGHPPVLASPPHAESQLEVPHGALSFPRVSGTELLFDKEPPWRGPESGGHLSLKDEGLVPKSPFLQGAGRGVQEPHLAWGGSKRYYSF